MATTMEQALAILGAERLDRILTAAMADPNAILRFADDIPPPAEPVQDYITEVDTRRALFDEFRAFLARGGNTMPNATVFAAFMIAPISEIRELLLVVGALRAPLSPVAYCHAALTTALNGIRACMLLFSYLNFIDTYSKRSSQISFSWGGGESIWSGTNGQSERTWTACPFWLSNQKRVLRSSKFLMHLLRQVTNRVLGKASGWICLCIFWDVGSRGSTYFPVCNESKGKLRTRQRTSHHVLGFRKVSGMAAGL
jgi:hypothetical protein